MFGLKMLHKFSKYLCSFFQYGGWKTDTQPQNDEKSHGMRYFVSPSTYK